MALTGPPAASSPCRSSAARAASGSSSPRSRRPGATREPHLRLPPRSDRRRDPHPHRVRPLRRPLVDHRTRRDPKHASRDHSSDHEPRPPRGLRSDHQWCSLRRPPGGVAPARPLFAASALALDLEAPTGLKQGYAASFLVTGGTPGRTVGVVYGGPPPGSCPPVLGGLCLSVSAPVLVGTAVVGAAARPGSRSTSRSTRPWWTSVSRRRRWAPAPP